MRYGDLRPLSRKLSFVQEVEGVSVRSDFTGLIIEMRVVKLIF